MHPAQQHGLRIPPLSFESAFSIRIPLVSAFLPEMTQQIHSLRARGVISSHTARAAGAETSAFRRSSGTLCTRLAGAFGVARATPPATCFLVIRLFYPRKAIRKRIATRLLRGQIILQLFLYAISLFNNYLLEHSVIPGLCERVVRPSYPFRLNPNDRRCRRVKLRDRRVEKRVFVQDFKQLVFL